MKTLNSPWGRAEYLVRDPSGWEITISVCGRERWALETLLAVGATGCTSISNPAPRLAAYVCSLRDRGVLISTDLEDHFGDFPGRHARYTLVAQVTPIKPVVVEQ